MASGWDGLNLERAKDAAQQKEIDSEDMRALRQQVKEFLSNPAAKQFILNHALGRCYVSGRSFEQTAFAEGERSLALKLLIMGGETSE